MGNFAEALLGLREELVIQRLSEAYAENGQVGFIARMRADVGFSHAASFGRLIGIKP